MAGCPGGWETTMRIRLMLLHPHLDIVLAHTDSERFVAMSRHLPSANRLSTYLQQWRLDDSTDDEDAVNTEHKFEEDDDASDGSGACVHVQRWPRCRLAVFLLFVLFRVF
jgi:hypothetical protein